MAVTSFISLLWRGPWFVGSWAFLIIRNEFGRLFGRDPYTQSKELQMRVDDSTKEVDNLRMKIDDLEEENENLRNKLDDFYKRSAQMMEESGSLENANDELSNTRLAERFDVALKEQWLQLCEALGETLSEIQYLTHLSEVMQSVFKHCMQNVEETERHLLQIAKYANEDQEEVRHNLRVLRKPLGQKQSTRDCVVKVIVDRVKQDDRVKDILTEHTFPDVMIKTIVAFINDLADVCWLLCIANPPLKLNFDIKGVDFKSVSNRFVEFASAGDITYSDCKPGAVYLVVWPSVEHEGSSGFLKKGEVIVCK
ncbi:uncharacterized protein LOC127877695 [Dreissena polymorpha]|uniref:Mitochondria-eating protein C-terminal domain-containing protein n=1 Tax=Dreissena polymorpha TaxID=45954 RepID=A0A9D4H7H8_DREPO|nr:uncharacterized protein LOC127877695 [Dreissena polymorpha]XP_052279774.1 uncharacterized protein LOC127877695 [Dreissena polymorpha]KAH3831054.1 hypothetical protein DPMN_104315 [Dreissena polymorpha]